MPGVVKIVAGVFGVVALVLGAIAAYLFFDAWTFAARAERAEGVVTAVVPGPGRRSIAAYPVIRFEATSGPVEFRSSSGSYPPSYRVGDKVPILYRAENPRDARLDSFVGLYLGAAIVGGIALAFGAAAGGALLVTRSVFRSLGARSGVR
jgi:hypothetical protein